MIQKQQHRTSCGVVAAANALEWSGIPVTYKEMVDYSKSEHGFKHKGMKFSTVQLMLDELGLETKKVAHPSVSYIEEELNKGNAVVLLYRWFYKGRNGGHFVFIDDHTDTQFNAWNMCGKNKTPRVSKKAVAKDLAYSKRHHGKDYPYAIVVKR